MKKSILLAAIFLCCVIITARAQSAPSPYVYKWPKYKDNSLYNKLQQRKLADSLRQALGYQKSPYSDMAVAGAMPKKFNYMGNNQQGFENSENITKKGPSEKIQPQFQNDNLKMQNFDTFENSKTDKSNEKTFPLPSFRTRT